MSKQAGKGDKRRPGDSEKFRANYTDIFDKKGKAKKPILTPPPKYEPR